MNLGNGARVFLFTDIEGSTQLWERFPATMPQVLARHDTLISRHLERYGGRMVKHTGDGIFAVFDAGAPLSCALEIQRAVRAEAWPDIGELRVRMALHAGPADDYGGDYFGPTINRAARILGVGWGGQILVTPDVVERCALPEHAWLADLGAHLLKDLIDRQPLYALLHPDLPQQFPPLRSLSAQPNNLPQQTTPFIGRRAALRDMGDLLVNGGCRLLTLVGPGGMGKTRTSIQTAAECADRFPQGVYFVPLAPLASHELLPLAIADAISARLPQTDDLPAQLSRYLAHKRMLLVLDNFEHLIDGAPLLGDIVAQASDVQLLVTSRQRLNLQAECLYELSGLEIPSSVDANVFEEFEAVDMFIAYARRHQPNYMLAPEDRPAVLQICRLVSGMPLGIQLAAAWVRTLPPAEIAAELAADLDFLASTLRDLPERHRSMRAIFEYSWNLLSQVEREAFARLSVFRGGFTAAAAKQVAGASLPILMTLVDKSLIQRDAQGRYQVHELLRQYAEQKLEADPEEATRLHDRHSDYHSTFLEERRTLIWGHGQRAVMPEVLAEQDNIRKMWQWATQRARAEDLLKSTLPIYQMLQIQTRYLEGSEAYEAAAHSLAAHEPEGVVGLALAEVLMAASWFHIRLGQMERASQTAAQSADLLRAIRGEPVSELGFTPLAALAIVYSLQGDYEGALTLGQEIIELGERLDYAFCRLHGHYVSIGPLVALGHYAEARQHADALVAGNREIGNEWFLAYCYIELANVLRLLGDYGQAEDYARKSYQIREGFEDQEGMAVARNLLAQLLLARGDHAGAFELFEQGLAIYREIGDTGGLAATLDGLGRAALLRGDDDAARDFFRHALETVAMIDYASLTMAILLHIAELWQREDQVARSLALLSFVLGAPSSDHETRARARRLLPEPAPEAPSLPGDLHQVAASVLGQLAG